LNNTALNNTALNNTRPAAVAKFGWGGEVLTRWFHTGRPQNSRQPVPSRDIVPVGKPLLFASWLSPIKEVAVTRDANGFG
jgi:hypothetical protein